MSSRSRPSRLWGRGSDALGAALTFAVTAALFAWLGFLADGRLGTSPLFLIVGLALGLVGGFLHLLRVLAPDLLPFGRPKQGSDAAPQIQGDQRVPGDGDEDGSSGKPGRSGDN